MCIKTARGTMTRALLCNYVSDYPITRFSSASTSARKSAASASEGIRKPVRGETVKLSTAGPSIRQERLNCWLK